MIIIYIYMASLASEVNKDGVPLNTVGAIQTDPDASRAARRLRGELTREEQAEKDYYTPAPTFKYTR